MQARLSHFAYSLVFLLGLSTLACSGLQKASYKQRYIERETAKHVYSQPLDSILPQARKLLFREGFQVRDTSDTIMETEYLSRGRYEDRYLVTATKAGKNWRIEFSLDRVNTSTNRAEGSRDLNMEWELLKLVDPTAARKLEREAEAYAAKK